jgi:aminoglycoside phosphotransferase (APT) family kinase protein
VAATTGVPVPRVVFCAAEEGVLAYRKLDGQPLLDVPAARRARLAPAVAATLGRLLAGWQAMPPDSVRGLVDIDDTPLEEWQDEAGRLLPAVAGQLSAGLEQAVRDFLAAAPPPSSSRRVFSHNDLGIEHVLVDPATGTVTGVLDWSDAAITDPARDFGLILRDLAPAGLDAALEAYGAVGEDPAGFRDRVVFYARCAGLEDLAYGLRSGQAAYLTKSHAALGWLFP